MADEEVKTVEVKPEAEPKPAETPPAREYASEEEKAADERYNEIWKGLTPRERGLVFELAAEKDREVKAGKTKPEELAKPAEKTAPTADDKLKAAEERLGKLEAALAKQETDRENANRAAASDRALNAVLSENPDYADDPELCDQIKIDFFGEYLKSGTKDIPRSFKAYLKRRDELETRRAKKKNLEHVEKKIADAEATRGEAGGGMTPSKKESKFTGADLDSGNIARKIKQEMGLTR